MATRLPASQRTREELRSLIEGRLSTAAGKDELIKLATRLIVEEALEGESGDVVGRDYYARGVHRRALRTTNLLERLFVEERRRLKIIPNAFGERAVLKLMFGALIRAAERWRSVKVTEFECRQMAAVRKELDQEYEATTSLGSQSTKGPTAAKLSSTSQT
jgi:transposase-like protein